MKFVLFFLSVLAAIQPTFCQNSKKDSLIRVINTTKTDTVKVLALKDLTLLLSRNEPEEAESWCRQCIELAEKIDYAEGIIRCHNNMGLVKIYMSDYYSALEHLNIALSEAKKVNNRLAVFRAHNNIGSVYITISDYGKAVESFTKALAIAEELNDLKSMAQCYNNIAIIHKDNKDYDKAMEYYDKAIGLSNALNDKAILGSVYSNISNIESIRGNLTGAISYCHKALAIAIAGNDQYGMGIEYANLGEYFFKIAASKVSHQTDKRTAIDSSLYYYNRALEMADKLKDEQRICNSIMGLGQIAHLNREYRKAHAYFTKAVEISKRIGMIENTMLAYGSLININEAMGRYKEALDNYRVYKAYSDSIFTTESQNSINEMEIRYQTEKKEKEIELLNRQKEIQSIRNRFLMAVIVIMIILLGFILYAFMDKRKHNKVLTLKNAEINKQREEISQQADILAEANHEITLQKNLIEKSHEKITDSINYAKYIQAAVMPSDENIARILPHYFILFKPCDIVSGDFYFIKKVDSRIYIAAADCTGHGVPGAFMSMLGIALLNELVRKPEIKGAASLLEMMRTEIKSSLQQTGQRGEQREGLDIALCILNSETRELNFAGAYNPLWLYQNHTLTEIPADRQPVGIHLKEQPFTEHTLQLGKGDTFYIFSDGYYSQFGGGNKEKLKTKRFREIITGISKLPFSEQKDELESRFYRWKGDEFQVDDVLVIGIQV